MNTTPRPTTTLRDIASGQVAGSLRQPRPDNFPAMLEAYKGEIARALPRHLNADNITRVALTCFRINPRLAECQPASVFACVIQASQLGLRPGILGECYLIPYRQRDEGYICTLQLGYQGLLELVRRSGLVDSISAHLVYERDEFDVQWGTEPGIRHKPWLDGDPGPVRLVYAVARLKGGGSHAELMTLEDIERIKNRSQNVQTAKRYGKTTPWDSDWGEMARKTALRRICKFLPKSTDLAMALALDDTAQRGQQVLSVKDAMDNAFVPPPYVDQDTGEIDPPAAPPTPQAAPAPQRGRPRKAAPAGGTPAPRPEDYSVDDGQAPDEPPMEPRSFEEYIQAVQQAPGAEAASLVLDEARSVLGPARFDDLVTVYRGKWSDET